MKLLLVNTNRMKPAIAPIGLDYLADSVMEAGHKPFLLDLASPVLKPEEVSDRIREISPDVVGVTIRNTDDCYFAGRSFFLPEIRAFVEFLRSCSQAPVILGGVGYSTAPEAILDFCGGDFGIAGEGEAAIVSLLDAIEKGRDFNQVPNLLYRHNGRTVSNARVETDLGQLPPRQRSFIDNLHYLKIGGQAGFETKRGCGMGCIYCADPVSKGDKVRLLPPRLVIHELRVLVSQGIHHFHTCDSEFNLPLRHAKEVCEAIIDEGLGEKIRWFAYCAPTPFDSETARLMKSAGCGGINFGVDSACDPMLKALGRHFTVSDLSHTAQLCRANSLPFMFDMLLGGPGETLDSIRQTIETVRSIEPDCVGLSLGLRIYPGTPLADSLKSSGDMAGNPNLYGFKEDDPDFLRPVFYIASNLGENLIDYVRDLVAGDQRFFLPERSAGNESYNYNENLTLIQAIQEGARGAYWDILRQLHS